MLVCEPEFPKVILLAHGGAFDVRL